MRCALFGPIPGSLPSSSIRSWTGPSNNSESRYPQLAHATGQWTEPFLGEDGHLSRSVGDRADDEILQRFDVVGVDDLRVDRHAHHLATAFHGDLIQAAAGLAVHLGVGELLLGFHQFLLHLLSLREECRHVGLASGLHDSPLAYRSRLGFARSHAAVWPFKPRRPGATLTPCTCQRSCVSA